MQPKISISIYSIILKILMNGIGTTLEEKINYLPPQARKDLELFVDFLLQKYGITEIKNDKNKGKCVIILEKIDFDAF